MTRSDWHTLSSAALRSGKSLTEAAESYRHANRVVHRNPHGTSPEQHERTARNKLIGRFLREGVSFPEARRRAEAALRDATERAPSAMIPGRDQQRQKERRNPDTSKLLLVGGAALGLWLWARQKAPGI